MRIGYDAKRANANNTGLGNYSRFVISALAQYTNRHTYLLFVPKHKNNNEYDALLNSYPNCEERQPKGIWRNLSALWRTFAIGRDLIDEGVDIFHGLSNEIPVGLAKYRNRGLKSVVTIHDLIFHRVPSNYRAIDRWIYDIKFRYACRHADRIIAVSECTKRDIVELYGTDPNLIEVIYQGCAEQFAVQYSQERKAAVRAKYNLPERFVLNVGTLEERKNLGLCVEALESLPTDIELVACGRATKYSDQVMSQARARGLESRITLLHKCDYVDLPVVYQCAEVFCYPSRYEGFGIPIIEALSSRVPAIGATGSCLEEAGGDAALYVDPNDAQGLARAIMRMIDDKELREESIARGLEHVKRFTKDRVASAIMSLYKSL